MRLHPMSIDGPIESFSPFHNINCPKGFLYFNKQVFVGQLPTEMKQKHNLDLLKKNLDEIPHKLFLLFF